MIVEEDSEVVLPVTVDVSVVELRVVVDPDVELSVIELRLLVDVSVVVLFSCQNLHAV